MPKQDAQPVLRRGGDGVVDVYRDGSLLKLVKKEARARHKERPGDGDEARRPSGNAFGPGAAPSFQRITPAVQRRKHAQ